MALGAWLGMMAPSCGTDNAPDPDLRYTERRRADPMNEDTEPSRSELLRASDKKRVTICMAVRGETRMLGAIIISWPREELYRPFKDQDHTLRLDS